MDGLSTGGPHLHDSPLSRERQKGGGQKSGSEKGSFGTGVFPKMSIFLVEILENL